MFPIGRHLLDHLPLTHRLRADTWRWESLKASLDATGDVGIVDTLLPAVDHAFTVKEVTTMVRQASLDLVTFIQPAAYRPETYVQKRTFFKMNPPCTGLLMSL